MTDRGMKWRFAFAAAFLTLAMLGLGSRLAFLHLGPHEEARAGFEQNRRVEKEIIARRGNIYDRRGQQNILAMNLPVKDVCADPSVVMECAQPETVVLKLSEYLCMTPDDVLGRVSRPGRQFAYVKRFVDDDTAMQLKEQRLPGVFFNDTTMRHYPHRSFMCHVLGFVNHEAVGSAGIEQRMDKYLRGTPGFLETRVNARRQELYWRRDSRVSPLSGADVVLTIDQNVQYIVEKALDEVVAKHNAKGAAVIVQKVRTGEILAMASRPVFDLNEFRTAGAAEKLNRAIGYNYEPGSTFKILTFAAALNEGTVTPDTVFDCENGTWYYKGRPLRDYHPYGLLTVADGLKKSSNILTAKVALTLGDERMYRYLKAFGVGDGLGIDLPGEERGILHPVSKWYGISSTRIAIGQGVCVTPLQMIGLMCTMANDGKMMRPYIVSHVRGSNGEILFQNTPKVLGRPISVETSSTMRRLLRRVTEDGGTGRRARVAGYEVAGKTGTAQKAVAGGYSSSANVASFVGFLPVDDPQIAVIVMVDEPQPAHTGGLVAAPVFSEIAGQTVRCLDIPPTVGRIAGQQPADDGHGES
jgi:cell division protein FtsI (penicillin-binding protein 3)